MSDFTDRVEKIMAERDMSWYSLAHATGLPLPTMYHYRSGVKPPADRAQKIADALGVTVAELLSDEEPITRRAARIISKPSLSPPATAAVLWLVPDKDHARAAKRGLVDADRKKYLKDRKALPGKMLREGVVCRWVEAEIGLAEMDRTVKNLGKKDDPGGRSSAILAIARKRGLV